MTTANTTAKLTDDQIIKKHSPSVRGRAYIELQIVNKLIEEAEKAGYILRIDQIPDIDLEDVFGGDFKTAIFDLDDATVTVIDPQKRTGFMHAPHVVGWIRLVFGNDGHDLIADYSTSLEEFLKPVNELADYWGS